MAVRDGVADRGDEFEFVAAIAHRRNSRGEIDRAPLDLLKVSVHVPEAGENGLAMRIDDIRVLGNLHLRSRTNRNDASVVDHDRGIRHRGGAGAVNQSAAHDGQGGGAAAGDTLGNFG